MIGIRLYAAVTAALIAILPFAEPNAAPCAAPASPYVKLDERAAQIRYLESFDRRNLDRLHRRHARPVDGWEPIGLTLAELGLSIAVSVRSEALDDGRFCSVLAAVEASVGYDSIDVYIASDYPRGSCQYGVILSHERQHVAVFEGTLNDYLPALRDILHATASRLDPVIGHDPKRAAKVLRDRLQQPIRRVFRHVQAALDERNGALDTGEQYRREQKQCLNW